MQHSDTPFGPTPEGHRHSAVAGLRDLRTREVFELGSLRSTATWRRRITIGRASTCDIALTDTCVSAVHCMVERLDDGRHLLHDHGATNGTFLLVAGVAHRITTAALTLGTWIWIGETTLATIDESGRMLLSATTETEFRREAYRAYGTLCAAGQAIGKSHESIRRAFLQTQAKRPRRRGAD